MTHAARAAGLDAAPRIARACVTVLVGLLAACALPGPRGDDAAGTAIEPALTVPAPSGAAAPGGASAKAPALAVQPWTDTRPGQPGRRIGTLDAPVFGVHDPRLVLSRDATELIGGATNRRLQADGFQLVPPTNAADITVALSLAALRLEVGARDQRHVAIQAVLRDARDGRLLWSGTVEDREERFAGVTGNSLRDLEHFLGAGIDAVVGRLAAQVRVTASATVAEPTTAAPRASSAAPQIPAAATGASTGTGAARDAAPPLAAPAAGAASAPLSHGLAAGPSEGRAAPFAEGHIAIVSEPARVKVYVGDVYHGLSPLTLALPPGVHQLHFKRRGCRDASEKVNVRAAVSVELELTLEDCIGFRR